MSMRLAALACMWTLLQGPGTAQAQQPSAPYRSLMQDVLIEADYWEDEPKILGAGLGFTEIIGVPGLGSSANPERLVRRAGGTWNDVQEPGAPQRAFTSALSPSSVRSTFGYAVRRADGFPVEFSWPVRPTTVQATDFRITLSNGRRVRPLAVSISPNLEYNERSTVVLFGRFGNRLSPNSKKAVYPVRLEIVRDSTPLALVGPKGLHNAVGMSFGDGSKPMTAYEPGKGPTLVAAKLTRMSTKGESAPLLFRSSLPNDGVALYGDQARFRLRVLTTGGFSPDGVRAIYPTEFATYFRLRARNKHGKDVLITKAGVDYTIDGHRLRVIGLADLGVKQDSYADGYQVDNDNQIDIVLDGDPAAMRKIVRFEIPASPPYLPLYNPGGPGNRPTPGVIYSQPSPTLSIPVRIALNDPMTVTRGAPPAD